MKFIEENRFLTYVIVILLIINSILLARLLGDIYLPGEVTDFKKAKQGAESVINYSENLAKSYGVANKTEVKDILAQFKYEVEKANTSEEVASIMVDYGRQVQDSIFREVQNKRINKVLNLVNSQKLPKKGNLTISNVEGEIKFVDSDNILLEETKNQLKGLELTQTIEIRIENNSAKLVTPVDIFNQVDFLQTKVASLQRKLNEVEEKSGYAKLSGEGIIIKVFDQKEQTENTGIVHSSDIRNIVDELLIAGAKGIEVGGQRITATTAIRCVGPTILINNKPISVNPITIKVIGESEVLKSSLDIINKQLQNFGIKLEIESVKEVVLNSVK